MSTPLRIALKFLGNTLLIAAMDHWLSSYLTVFGGWPAYIIIGALLTLLNFSVRPLLNFFFFPLKLLASLVAILLCNTIFLWIVYQIILRMDPDLIALIISGGIGGWILVSLILGLGNWIIRMIVR